MIAALYEGFGKGILNQVGIAQSDIPQCDQVFTVNSIPWSQVHI